MPGFNDDIFLGTAIAGGPDATPSGEFRISQGVGPMGRTYMLDMVPAASGATVTQNEICPSANLPAGALVCTANGTTTTAGYDPFGNALVVIAGEPRNIAIYSAADHSTKTLTVVGYDQYGQAMSEAITAPNATTVFGKKAFKSIKSVTNTTGGAIASACVVGFGTSVGLPFRVTDMGYVGPISYNQAIVTWNSTNIIVADVTATATTTTGDVRGRLVLGQTDGSKRLVVQIAIPALGSGPNATRIGAFGVTQV
jgi:hypothetical protein